MSDRTTHPSILDCGLLKLLTGYSKPADVAKCLRRQGIAVFSGREGVFTTIELINAAGGLDSSGDHSQKKYAPDDIG